MNTRLSICIPTFNRAELMRETIQSIVVQLTAEVEIVISDNASTDHTEQVATDFARKFPNVRYFKNPSNVGLDRNFDRAVERSRGEYCWLLSDDDVLLPNAVSTVLGATRQDLSLILVNHERRNFEMTEVLIDRYVNAAENRIYSPEEFDSLFSSFIGLCSYAGAIIVARELWLQRDREQYFGSTWIHLGVLYQQKLPKNSLFIASPLISYREGNTGTFWPDIFEVLAIRFPSVIRSLPISDIAMMAAGVSKDPSRAPQRLLWHRAMGFYSPLECKRLILPRVVPLFDRFLAMLVAYLPGAMVNAIFVLCWSVTWRRKRRLKLFWLSRSPFHLSKYVALRWATRLTL